MNLKSKFAVVTGASTGIGREISIALGKEGAFVALVARTKDRLEETKKLVEKAGGGMSKGARIINISGTFENGAKGWIPYYVSKRAIEDLTIGLSQEFERKNIFVNAISPSDCATDAYKKYFPQYIKDAIDPNEIAKFVIHLCSVKADGITGKVFVLKKNQKPFEHFHY